MGGRLRSNNAIRNAMDGRRRTDIGPQLLFLSFFVASPSPHPPVSSSLTESCSAVVPASRGISLDPESGILAEKGTEGKGE